MNRSVPLNDEIIIALANLVDDSQIEKREPSHSVIESLITRFNLINGDPKQMGLTVGKAKRIRATLTWALENDLSSGEAFTYSFISTVRGVGGFRRESPNFCGMEAINNLQSAFSIVAWDLLPDGVLQPKILESLPRVQQHEALLAYAQRARRGALDSPLLTGTSKDLLEATAAHVLVQIWGSYSDTSNFPTLLGQAFTALELATSHDQPIPSEPPNRRFERAAFEVACSLNAFRNKEGTGHGRPWISGIKDSQARYAIEMMGVISEFLLATLSERK